MSFSKKMNSKKKEKEKPGEKHKGITIYATF